MSKPQSCPYCGVKLTELSNGAFSCSACGQILAHTPDVVSLFDLHTRALCAHAECLGLNSENFHHIVNNEAPIYTNQDFSLILLKWGLIDELNNPIKELKE